MGTTRNVILAAALVASAPAAAGEEEATAVFNQLSADYTDCFVYHLIGKRCAPETATPDQLAQMQSMIDAANEGQITAGKVVGLSDAALAARIKLSTEALGKLTENECVNFSVLIVKYGTFCRDLEQNPTRRAQELRDQAKRSP